MILKSLPGNAYYNLTFIVIFLSPIILASYHEIKYSIEMKFQIYFAGGKYVTVVGYALYVLGLDFRTSAETISLGFHTTKVV